MHLLELKAHFARLTGYKANPDGVQALGVLTGQEQEYVDLDLRESAAWERLCIDSHTRFMESQGFRRGDPVILDSKNLAMVATPFASMAPKTIPVQFSGGTIAIACGSERLRKVIRD